MKFRQSTLLLIPLLLFLSLPLLHAQNARIEGKIYDKKTQQPIPGINVGLISTTLGSSTNEQGHFIIRKIPAGTYVIRATGIGYTTYRDTITLDRNETRKLDIHLQADVLNLDKVVVSASRSVEYLDEVPSSVSVVQSEELQEQEALNHNLNDILARTVPGIAQSTQSASNWGQNLRGRNMLVMIDGIPQSTPLRPVSRDLLTIEPSAIKRIEVIKGATAIYGHGATGGLINYITKTPDQNGFNSKTVASTNSSLSEPSNSMGYRFNQSVYGKTGDLSYYVSGAYEEVGLYKDAAGDIIPPNPQGQGGLSDASIVDLYGKFNYTLGAKQNIELMYNYYNNDQNTQYVTVPGQYPGQKATVKQNAPEGEPQGTKYNHNVRLTYNWLDVIGQTSLQATAYHQNYKTIFGYHPSYWEGGGQSLLDAEKYGLRLNLDTPLSITRNLDSKLIYGVDLLNDNTAQPLTDGRLFAPEMQMYNAAPYLQFKARYNDFWIIKGGLRYEDINIRVDDYETIMRYNYQTGNYYGGDHIEGGSLNYSALTYNLGVNYRKFDRFSPFASVSQGFSIADLGRTLRSTTEPTTINKLDPEPVIVQNYEVGINSLFDHVKTKLSAFVSTSDLGTSYQENDEGRFVIVRSPEIVYGLEATLDVRPTERLGFGGSYSLTEGRSDNNNNGSYADPADAFLVNSRISPPKLTSYVSYRFTSKLKTRVSVLYSGERNRFQPQSDGSYTAYRNPIDSYTLIDLTAQYELPFGSLDVGVSNLLNTDYYPVISQWAGHAFPSGYSKGPGARANVSLTVKL